MRRLISTASPFVVAIFLGVTIGHHYLTVSAAQTGTDASKAWDELVKASQPPRPPAAWQKARPTQEEIDKFKASEAERLAKAADSARDFQKIYPKDAHASEAASKEYELLQTAAQLGKTNVLARLEAIEESKLKDPKTPADERFQIRATAVNRNAMSKLPQGMSAALAELEKGAQSLVKEFPNRAEGYQMLLDVASESGSDKSIALAKQVRDSTAPDPVKDAAGALLKKMERLGKPLPIQFTAVDGRSVDLAKLKGKVVLVDFWATWCGPCVGEIPNVRATYEKLHPKGFEIVGISFDADMKSLLSFVEQNKMTWPQYFDGKRWENEYGKRFGIQSIPAMWLVDKKGQLRDLNAREGLADKAEKLLSEN